MGEGISGAGADRGALGGVHNASGQNGVLHSVFALNHHALERAALDDGVDHRHLIEHLHARLVQQLQRDISIGVGVDVLVVERVHPRIRPAVGDVLLQIGLLQRGVDALLIHQVVVDARKQRIRLALRHSGLKDFPRDSADEQLAVDVQEAVQAPGVDLRGLSADDRVALHQQRPRSGARRGQRRADSGKASADHQYVHIRQKFRLVFHCFVFLLSAFQSRLYFHAPPAAPFRPNQSPSSSDRSRAIRPRSAGRSD